MRSKSVLYTLFGHNDTVTSLSLSPSGTHILSASADDTIRVWDVRPFAPSSSSSGDPNADPRLYKTFPGAAAGFEGWLRKAAWDRDGSRIAVGGADRSVTIYNVEQSRLTHKLPGEFPFYLEYMYLLSGNLTEISSLQPAGHTGFVTAVDFSPKDNIVASCGVDRAIYLGEIPER
jgi:Prp8 binding protein